MQRRGKPGRRAVDRRLRIAEARARTMRACSKASQSATSGTRGNGDKLLPVKTDKCRIDKIINLHHIRHLADIAAHSTVDFGAGRSWKHGEAATSNNMRSPRGQKMYAAGLFRFF